jgi:hypothetical protein
MSWAGPTPAVGSVPFGGEAGSHGRWIRCGPFEAPTPVAHLLIRQQRPENPAHHLVCDHLDGDSGRTSVDSQVAAWGWCSICIGQPADSRAAASPHESVRCRFGSDGVSGRRHPCVAMAQGCSAGLATHGGRRRIVERDLRESHTDPPTDTLPTSTAPTTTARGPATLSPAVGANGRSVYRRAAIVATDLLPGPEEVLVAGT